MRRCDQPVPALNGGNVDRSSLVPSKVCRTVSALPSALKRVTSSLRLSKIRSPSASRPMGFVNAVVKPKWRPGLRLSRVTVPRTAGPHRRLPGNPAWHSDPKTVSRP